MDRKITFWLAALLAAQIIFSAGVITVLLGRGQGFREAAEATALGPFTHKLRPWYRDSWDPMLTAYNAKLADPSTGLYRVFFEDRVKFQYPPSSLLFFDLFPRSWTRMDGGEFNVAFWKFLKRLSLSFLLLSAGLTALILETAIGRVSRVRAALTFLLGLIFYPLVFGNEIGQIQVFLNTFISAAVLCYLRGRREWSGFFIGLCCLVKPQMAIVLVWGALRGQWKFVAGFAVAFIPGIVAALLRFGWTDHLGYLEVLKMISRQGESYWFNQSVNGLTNRWLNNGSPVSFFGPTYFAPFHPVVYSLTVASSILIALSAFGRGRTVAGVADLSAMLAAATMASPVAWNHHYGLFLPLFAVNLPAILSVRPLGKHTALLCMLSYFAMSVVIVRPEFIFQNRWLGLAGSHVFFGALLFYVLLLKLRRAEDRRA